MDKRQKICHVQYYHIFPILPNINKAVSRRYKKRYIHYTDFTLPSPSARTIADFIWSEQSGGKQEGGGGGGVNEKKVLAQGSQNRERHGWIRPTKYEDFEATNIIDCHEVRNTRGFQLPAYNTKQYQNSFFVRTVVDWNHLEENIVKAGSVCAFTSALSRSTPPAS